MNTQSAAARCVDAVRQRSTPLIVMTIVVIALVASRTGRQVADVAAAKPSVSGTNAKGADSDTMREAAGIAVTWPVELQRDLFAWESVLERRQDPKASRTTIEKEARKSIRLQAIIFGESPKAIVNGQVFQAGHSIGAFVIQRVEPRHIIVERDGVEVLIEISNSIANN